MEDRRHIIFILLLFELNNLTAQIHIGFNSECLDANSITLTRAILDLKDEQFIENVFENRSMFLFLMNVDSLGYVVTVEKTRPESEVLSEKVLKEIESYLIDNKIRFYICFFDDTGESFHGAYKRIKKNLFKDKDTHLINVSFPGTLILGYKDEKREKILDKPYSSKYYYLRKRINEYSCSE